MATALVWSTDANGYPEQDQGGRLEAGSHEMRARRMPPGYPTVSDTIPKDERGRREAPESSTPRGALPHRGYVTDGGRFRAAMHGPKHRTTILECADDAALTRGAQNHFYRDREWTKNRDANPFGSDRPTDNFQIPKRDGGKDVWTSAATGCPTL